jgi:hypothetical protein
MVYVLTAPEEMQHLQLAQPSPALPVPVLFGSNAAGACKGTPTCGRADPSTTHRLTFT